MTKPFYITTSIPYVNGAPHIGHALEFVEADAIARYQRMLGNTVRFLTGADEHGAKIARAAEVAGKTPREFVDGNVAILQNLLTRLSISHDDFIRTSDSARHWPGAGALWQAITDAGDIYKASYKGMYCVGHEAFVTDKDLVNGVCEDHGKAPEIIEEENYFFRLSRYQKEIEDAIRTDTVRVIPETRKNEVLMFLRSGLEDVSFSRPAKDIPWGVPVPGDETQNMYVWCDALSNYISALGYGGEDPELFSLYWPADMHVIGKDILRFHAVIWIGMLLAAKLPLPKRILVHGHLLSNGKKMSKTLGNVIDPLELIDTYGAEAVRFFLLKEVSVFEDGDITKERIKISYNANLANGIGNLVSRTAKMIETYFGGVIEKPSDEALFSAPLTQSLSSFEPAGARLATKGVTLSYLLEEQIEPKYASSMEEFRLHDAMAVLWHFISLMDGYIQEYEPFKLVKTDTTKTQAILWHLAHGLVKTALLLYPCMPETSERMLAVFGITKDTSLTDTTSFSVTKGEGLFPRI